MPHSDFSSSFGSEKLYGNTSIDPPNGLARCGEFVSVTTSCRSASKRCAMYLPQKPKAPVTAIRTLAFHHTEKITHSARYRNSSNGWLFPANRLRSMTGKDGNERARLSAPRFSLADSHEAAAVAIQTWVIGTHGGVRRVASGFPIAAPAGPSPVLTAGCQSRACAAQSHFA